MEEHIEKIFKMILDGDNQNISGMVAAALSSGVPASKILDAGMIQAMAEVGRLFEAGDFFVPEMLISARAMQVGLAVLKPYLVQENYQTSIRVAIGTVKGDLHDIGKNLVGMMLEGAGFDVLDLGVDVTPEQFVEAAGKVDVIALSALLTTTMPGMQLVIEGLNQAGLRKSVKVIVGGAPVTPAYAAFIGADGYAPDASRAVSVVKNLLGE